MTAPDDTDYHGDELSDDGLPLEATAADEDDEEPD